MGDPHLKCSDSAKFICNICGGECPPPGGGFRRESAPCPHCGSVMRERALAALLSTEFFGMSVALTELPTMKCLRGIGMSDTPALAEHLAKKFDYTNTFYHQAPYFDAAHVDQTDAGRYDFIFSSEVMEHVIPPVENAFAALARVLKPEGVLLLTTPYNLEGKTEEHFPDLYEYSLASVGGRAVLVNRRRDGRIEVFENLTFHGGQGSTLELRAFTQKSLCEVLRGAGFSDVRLAAEDIPEFGIHHAETWSLPLAVRKGAFKPFPADFARAHRDLARQAANLEHELVLLRKDYQSYAAFHEENHRELQADIAARTEWARKMESDLEVRTQWALALQRENEEAARNTGQAQKSEREAWERVTALEKSLAETRALQGQLERRLWTRVGRKLGMVK